MEEQEQERNSPRYSTTSGKEATVVVIQHVQQQDPSSTYSRSFSLPLWIYPRALVGKG